MEFLLIITEAKKEEEKEEPAKEKDRPPSITWSDLSDDDHVTTRQVSQFYCLIKTICNITVKCHADENPLQNSEKIAYLGQR